MSNFQSLLKDSKHLQDAFNKPVMQITGSSYSLLFCRAFAERCAEALQMPFVYQSVQTDSLQTAMAALKTTFLGQNSFYWLGSIDDAPKKHQKEWLSFFKTYDGPHTVLFFSKEKIALSAGNTIALADTVSPVLFNELTHFFNGKRVSFARELFVQSDKLEWDTAFLLLRYAKVLGQRSELFAKEWLPNMITPDVSLFALSQSLFERNKQSFFARWKNLSSRYTAPFWTTYFSEQLWRAYAYIYLQQKNKPALAKQVGYRLPFSFLQRSWRNHSLAKLKESHRFLTEIDYHIKNGGSDFALELFFSSFFLQ